MPAASDCFSSAKFSCKFVGLANKSADKKLPIGICAASVCSVWAHSMITPHVPPINRQLIRT